jgi:hypothetical protein
VSNRVPDLRPTIAAKHPFESCFVDLGNHSADKALIALTHAVHAEQREMNAYDWIAQARRSSRHWQSVPWANCIGPTPGLLNSAD